MVKKIPLRKCVVTKELLPKKELLRIVKTKEGNVFVDTSSKANGRGAYIKKDHDTLQLAIKTKALSRALETQIDDTVYEDIKKVILGE